MQSVGEIDQKNCGHETGQRIVEDHDNLLRALRTRRRSPALSVVRCFATDYVVIERRLWLIWLLILSGFSLVQQATALVR